MSGVHRTLTFMATALCMALPAAARGEEATGSGTDAEAAGKVKEGLAVHPDGHYFTLDGEPVVLFGAGNWVVIPAGERRHPFSVDYELIHRTVAPFSANANRAALYGFGDADMMPWVHEDGRFDLDRWNGIYWQRLRSYLRSAREHGIVPIIQIFDHPSAKPHRDPQRWQSNPFNPANNVNDVGELPTEGYHPPRDFYNADNEQLMKFKAALVRKLIDETHEFNHIIYQLDNEHPHGVGPWADRLLEVFGERSRHYGRTFLVSNMTMNHRTQMAHARDDRITVIEAFHTYRTGGYARQVDLDTMHKAITDFFYECGGKPVILGRGSVVPARGQGSIEAMRWEWFTALLAGGQIGSPRVIFDLAGDDPEAFHKPTLEVIAHVHRFAAAYPFWQMRPVRVSVDGAYLSMTPDGDKAALYWPAAQGRTALTLDIARRADVEPGTRYRLRWYNPATGEFAPEQHVTVDSDGQLTLHPPHDHPDWAATLQR